MPTKGVRQIGRERERNREIERGGERDRKNERGRERKKQGEKERERESSIVRWFSRYLFATKL